ncbi:MAG: hypothetical protein LHV69_11340 [Elusimicrobia bacterium]|nr:hypothetical protein [Candidatus Obscuribacterium magneticum]
MDVVPVSSTTVQALSNLTTAVSSFAQSQSRSSGMSISDIGSLLGMVFGTAALTFSAMNYLRDRPKVKVFIQWDMDAIGDGPIDKKKKWGIVNVANVGRRPIFVSHVAIRLPPKEAKKYFLVADTIYGKKLCEGDPPATFLVDQERMKEYAKHWKNLRVQISDSAGKVYFGDRTKKKPSWGVDAG